MALVRYPVDNNPDHGGGPIRRTEAGANVYSGEGMPPHGYPTKIYRQPGEIVPDAEPGGARVKGLDHMMFLPDGRLVQQSALHGSGGRVSYQTKLALARVARSGGLGDGLFPDVPESSRPGAAPGLLPGQVYAPQALESLQKLFAEIQAQAKRISEVYKGHKVPCKVRETHNSAVAHYVDAMGYVLRQISAQGGTPVQKYKHVDGTVGKEIQGDVPLPPTTFVLTDCKSKTGSTISGSGFGFVWFLVIGVIVVILGGVAITHMIVNKKSDAHQASEDDLARNKARMDCYTQHKDDPEALKLCPDGSAPAAAFPWGYLVMGLVAVAGIYIYSKQEHSPSFGDSE